MEEGIRLILAQIRINAANREVHLCHLPCVGVGLLPKHRHCAALSAVRLNEFCTLHEHPTGATAGVVYTTI